MPGYNNYQNYGNYANYPTQNQFSGNQFTGMRSNAIPQQTVPSFGYQQQPQMPDNRFQLVDYVSGRSGADNYQLPNGVTHALLFDEDAGRMFVKGYDNNGRPRVLEDHDYHPHVEPEPKSIQSNIDLSDYATKQDIRNMIAEVVTRDDLNKALSELSVGNGGRIVRINEQIT